MQFQRKFNHSHEFRAVLHFKQIPETSANQLFCVDLASWVHVQAEQHAIQTHRTCQQKSQQNTVKSSTVTC